MVLSGSMEPAFYRGDILFLYMGRKPFSAGEVVVFNINGRDIPIVHRIIKVHETLPGSKEDDVRILTKVRSCMAHRMTPCGVLTEMRLLTAPFCCACMAHLLCALIWSHMYDIASASA